MTTTIKQAQKRLSEITRKRAQLEKQQSETVSIEQALQDADAEAEAQRAEIEALQMNEAEKQLDGLRKRAASLYSKYGKLADRLDTIKGDADSLALEMSEVCSPHCRGENVRFGSVDIDMTRGLAQFADVHSRQIAADAKWFTEREAKFNR